MGIAISLIIPAYNETVRLPPYLDEVRAYLGDVFEDEYEVIVVDDGSSDGLAEKLTEIARQWPQLRTCSHATNRGKGAAVCTGMRAAEGRLLLFADADGATRIEEEIRLREAIEAGADVALGSRLVNASGVVRQRTRRRALVGRLFAHVARAMLRLGVRDTQCGFKMFRRAAGKRLFELITERGYLFDLELLILARQLDYRVAEVAINWSDQPGSQLNMRSEWSRILKGLWRLHRRQITLKRFPPD